MIIVCVSSPEPTGGIQECFASIAVSNTKLEPTKTEKMPKKTAKFNVFEIKRISWKIEKSQKIMENFFFSNFQKMIFMIKLSVIDL